MRFLVCNFFLILYLYGQAPQLFLLKTYKDDINVTGWVMSEKYDGVRAIWDGQKLVSRSGKVFTSPSWFTKDFPPFALDGELWSKRGDFENIVSIVNTKDSGSAWKALRYMVFEVPKQEGSLDERLKVLETYLTEHENTRIKIIEQIKVNDTKEVKVYFDKLREVGAEGIVLRNPSLSYYVGRKKDALKHKPYIDAECKVIGFLEGKGKYKGMLGALKCDYEGKVIKIGSGFSDEERKSSFDIGRIITFKYYGLTRLGNPKYPVFLRVRRIK